MKGCLAANFQMVDVRGCFRNHSPHTTTIPYITNTNITRFQPDNQNPSTEEDCEIHLKAPEKAS